MDDAAGGEAPTADFAKIPWGDAAKDGSRAAKLEETWSGFQEEMLQKKTSYPFVKAFYIRGSHPLFKTLLRGFYPFFKAFLGVAIHFSEAVLKSFLSFLLRLFQGFLYFF